MFIFFIRIIICIINDVFHSIDYEINVNQTDKIRGKPPFLFTLFVAFEKCIIHKKVLLPSMLKMSQ